jgi:TonB-linked outer membrane protein, SusC/RagA family
MLFLFSISAFGQTITVKGTVKDATNATLPGVNVRIQGSSSGTITDVDGKYSIQVPSNAKLEFSFVGYTSQLISVSGKTTLNVTLSEDTKALNEVVVIGYGTQRKEAVTGSVASVKGDIMREVPAANISQALQGRVAGVDMSQTSTKPGATMQIRIRGTRSINANNDPLIVLDGIPFAGTIADISTEDIKSLEILKDASATAIYGSRGANGVILVTTFKGNKGQKAQITYSGYYGINKAIKYPMMNASEYAALRARAGLNKTPGLDEPYTTNPDGSISYSSNTDWQDLFYQTGTVQSHDLSVSGGTEKGSYKFGANYYNQQAVIPNSYYNRYSVRGSVDMEVGKWFHVGLTTNNNFNITNGASLGMYGILSMSPVASPYNSDGTFKRTVRMPQDEQWVYTRSTMAALGDGFADKTKAFGSYNSAYAEAKIPYVEGLKYRINLGANYRQSNSGYYQGIGIFSATATTPNSASIGNSLTTNWAVENLLTYDHVFLQKHRVNALGMYSREQTWYNSSSISRKNISGDTFQYFNLGNTSTSSNDDITINPNSQGYSVSGLESYMGRIMYSYDDRYMISGTVRSDASSVLAPGHKWHTYPAVSLGWNINKESFMKDFTWLETLKLRMGIGQTSNQAVSAYNTLGFLSTIPYNFGASNYATGYYVSQLPNPSLGWEYSKTKNVGLEFSLFKNRLSGTAEYYVTDTKDILLKVALPPTAGVNSIMQNVGATQNKGFELSLNGVILDNLNGWTWEAGINFYTNKNKIVKLSSGQTQDISNLLFVGHSLNVLYDYKKVGLYQTTAEAQKYEGSAGKAGMIKVLYTGTYDSNGNPTRIIGAADKQIYDCDPDFMGGFNTRVAYKGFDLSVVGTFQHGGILNSLIYGSSGYLNLEDGRRGQVKIDYWTENNTGAKYPDPNGPKDSNNPKYGSTLGYFSASYMKIKTISLGYNVNPKWIQKAGIEKLRVYVTVQNPFVFFSPYHTESGLDPETNSYASDTSTAAVAYSSVSRLLTQGYNTPVTHNYLMGINITF